MLFCTETNSFLAFSLFSHWLPTTGKESNSKENDNLGTMQVSTIQDREQNVGTPFRGPGVLHTSEYTENCLPNWRRKSSGHFPWGYKVATSLLVPYMRGRPGLKVCSFRITLKANSMVVTSPKTQKLNFMLLLCGTCCKYNAQSSLKIFAQKNLCIGIDTYSILQKNIFAFTKTVFERRYFEMIAPIVYWMLLSGQQCSKY